MLIGSFCRVTEHDEAKSCSINFSYNAGSVLWSYLMAVMHFLANLYRKNLTCVIICLRKCI